MKGEVLYVPATMTHPAYIELPDEMACEHCGRVVGNQDIETLNDGGTEFVCAPCYRTATAPVDCGDCIAVTQGRNAQ